MATMFCNFPFVNERYFCSVLFLQLTIRRRLSTWLNLYYQDPLLALVHLWYIGRYGSKIFIQHCPDSNPWRRGQGHILRIRTSELGLHCLPITLCGDSRLNSVKLTAKRISLTLVIQNNTGLDGSVGCASDWRSGGCGFDPAGSATFFRGD